MIHLLQKINSNLKYEIFEHGQSRTEKPNGQNNAATLL